MESRGGGVAESWGGGIVGGESGPAAKSGGHGNLALKRIRPLFFAVFAVVISVALGIIVTLAMLFVVVGATVFTVVSAAVISAVSSTVVVFTITLGFFASFNSVPSPAPAPP